MDKKKRQIIKILNLDMHTHNTITAYGSTQNYQVWPGVQTWNQLDVSKVNQKDMPLYLQLLTDTRIDVSCLDFFLFQT